MTTPLPTLTFDMIKDVFHLSAVDAAAALGVCPTRLKRKSRKMGVPRWPYRRVSGLQRQLKALEADFKVTTDSRARRTLERKLLSCKRELEDIRTNPASLKQRATKRELPQTSSSPPQWSSGPVKRTRFQVPLTGLLSNPDCNAHRNLEQADQGGGTDQLPSPFMLTPLFFTPQLRAKEFQGFPPSGSLQTSANAAIFFGKGSEQSSPPISSSASSSSSSASSSSSSSSSHPALGIWKLPIASIVTDCSPARGRQQGHRRAKDEQGCNGGSSGVGAAAGTTTTTSGADSCSSERGNDASAEYSSADSFSDAPLPRQLCATDSQPATEETQLKRSPLLERHIQSVTSSLPSLAGNGGGSADVDNVLAAVGARSLLQMSVADFITLSFQLRQRTAATAATATPAPATTSLPVAAAASLAERSHHPRPRSPISPAAK